ncbi:MAG: helix-turn-helix transcriptional regulator [Fibrobacter sp.]|nr:helix-turn-helix transcriptional regulator [Fibrobacter sp.]
MKLSLYSESDIMLKIAGQMKLRRLALNLTQKEAAERSGLSFMTISKFEKTGIISLRMLASLLIAYGMENRILSAFSDREWWTLDELQLADEKKRVKHARD